MPCLTNLLSCFFVADSLLRWRRCLNLDPSSVRSILTCLLDSPFSTPLTGAVAVGYILSMAGYSTGLAVGGVSDTSSLSFCPSESGVGLRKCKLTMLIISSPVIYPAE